MNIAPTSAYFEAEAETWAMLDVLRQVGETQGKTDYIMVRDTKVTTSHKLALLLEEKKQIS